MCQMVIEIEWQAKKLHIHESERCKEAVRSSKLTHKELLIKNQ